MRRLGIVAVVGILVFLFALMVEARPDCDRSPNSRWCRTTTTAPPSSTTTPQPPSTTTSTSTTFTTSTTTTTVPSADLSLRADLIVDGTTHQFTGHIEGNGYQILVVNGGQLDWDGFTVNNVRRVMFTDCAGPSTLRNGEVTNSGSPALGDYPLHWHLNGDCTRGTLVENVTVRNGAHHAFVPHGSHGITFRNVSAFNIIRTAFWWDAPGTNRLTCSETARHNQCVDDNSNDIIIDGLHIDGVSHPRSLEPCCSAHHRVTGVLLGAGSGNVIRNSTVLNVVGGADCSGYHWPESANGNIGGNVWVFENNHAASTDDCKGIFVWQNDDNLHVVDGFTGDGISHGAYSNIYHYQNVTVPYLRVHALGWTMSDSQIGEATVSRHVLAGGPVTFTNVTFDSFSINNANGHPGTYILNQTNLTCDDIVWVSWMEGTKVLIDGIGCLP